MKTIKIYLIEFSRQPKNSLLSNLKMLVNDIVIDISIKNIRKQIQNAFYGLLLILLRTYRA